VRIDPKIAPAILYTSELADVTSQKGNLAGALTAKAKLNRLELRKAPKRREGPKLPNETVEETSA
jgi:hypothetical protein